MKNISTDLKNHLSNEVTTIANCWKISRRDGYTFGLTDLDKDINFDGVNYVSANGFNNNRAEFKSENSSESSEIFSILSSDLISESDILSGKYDYAEIEIFKINYNDFSQGKLTLRTGWIGKITQGKNGFIAELRGLKDRLSNSVSSYYSPVCAAGFGDEKCQVNAEDYTYGGTVENSSSEFEFVDSTRTENLGFFNYGIVKFLSGLNANLSYEIRQSRGATINLALPCNFPISVGDTYQIAKGCDKSFSTCKTTYDNAINFRGQPHVPGTDAILKTAANI
jgi:uncharacterized phage protein (TIGR02218 family)